MILIKDFKPNQAQAGVNTPLDDRSLLRSKTGRSKLMKKISYKPRRNRLDKGQVLPSTTVRPSIVVLSRD